MICAENEKTGKDNKSRRLHNDPSQFVVYQRTPLGRGMPAIRGNNTQSNREKDQTNGNPHINNKIKCQLTHILYFLMNISVFPEPCVFIICLSGSMNLLCQESLIFCRKNLFSFLRPSAMLMIVDGCLYRLNT